MKMRRAIRLEGEYRVRIIDLFSRAKIFHIPSRELNERFRDIIQDLPKGTPGYVKEYLTGYRDALIKELYRDHLDFRYVVGTKLVSILKGEPTYYEKMGFTVSDLSKATSSGHYYRGTGRPFFVS